MHNGVLTLTRGAAGGNLFDRLKLHELEMGRFTPLIYQKVEQQRWVAPDTLESVQVSNGPVRLVMDITTASHGQYAFRSKFRLVVEPGRPWLTSQLRWLENADTTPWELAGYYHYLPSNIGGHAQDDQPREDHWFNPATHAAFGIHSLSPLITTTFYKDAASNEHPDAYRPFPCSLPLASASPSRNRQSTSSPAVKTSGKTCSGKSAGSRRSCGRRSRRRSGERIILDRMNRINNIFTNVDPVHPV